MLNAIKYVFKLYYSCFIILNENTLYNVKLRAMFDGGRYNYSFFCSCTFKIEIFMFSFLNVGN